MRLSKQGQVVLVAGLAVAIWAGVVLLPQQQQANFSEQGHGMSRVLKSLPDEEGAGGWFKRAEPLVNEISHHRARPTEGEGTDQKKQEPQAAEKSSSAGEGSAAKEGAAVESSSTSDGKKKEGDAAAVEEASSHHYAGGHGTQVRQVSTLDGRGSSRSIVRVGETWTREQLNSKQLREHGPCAQHLPSGEEALIVRMCCDFTPQKAETIKHWADQLQGAMDFWILFDYKDASEEKIAQMEEDIRRLQVDYDFSVFLYNTHLAERLYPAARHTLEDMAALVNWAVHEVSIAAWWRVCAKHSWGDDELQETTPLLPTNVWSIEADAMFAGDAMDFFNYYKKYDEHFITGWTAECGAGWVAEKYGKLPGMSVIPFDVMYNKPDAVMRFSSRLMYHMDSALRCNLILYGEMYASTICLGIFSDWCDVIHLVDGPFYSPEPGGFNSVHYLNSTEWETRLTDPALKNRWYHPIAALKEHKRRLTKKRALMM